MDLDLLKKNNELYSSYNKLKLENSARLFTDKQKVIFKILPFLLHTNIKGLPGYIDSKNIPCGIFEYKITEQILNIIKNIFSLERMKVIEPAKCFIESLSIMGSIGSIAQNEKSDFDFWVCINKNDISADDFELFKIKLKGVEDWCAHQKVETHLFPVDINSILRNDFGAADDESCGSAQAVLLKDEYFRSAIHIEGKVPLWWISPLECEYSHFINELEKTEEPLVKRFAEDFIDIGYIDNVNKEEFFGAGLWQLVKSLHSPFKSFIKMSLLEKYISHDTDIDLLSEQLKKNIMLEKLDIRSIDQYISMFTSVNDFYGKRSNFEIIDILRTCFYLKVSPDLSKKNSDQISASLKTKIMNEFCGSWGWDKSMIKKLDSFNSWPFKELSDFDGKLKKFMITNFVNLRNSLKTLNVSSIISEDDFTVISRKLLAYYLKKKSKVEYFYFSFDDSFFEETLNIVYDPTSKKWAVNRFRYESEADLKNQTGLVFESKYLSEVCHRLAYYKIYNEWRSNLKVYAPFPVNFNNIRNFMTVIQDFFSKKISVFSKRDYFINDNFIIKCFVSVNFDFPNNDNVEDISMIYLNSWGEMFFEHLSSYSELLLKTDVLMENYNKIKHLVAFDDFFNIFIPEGSMGVNLPLKKMYQKFSEFFFTKRWFGTEGKIFITCADGEYFGLCQYKKEFSIFKSTSNLYLFDSFFPFKNMNLYFEYDNSIRDAGFFQAIFSRIEIGKDQFYSYCIGDYYVWLFFDVYNLPTLGGIQVDKFEDFVITFKEMMTSISKKIEMFNIRKDINNNYAVSPLSAKKKSDLKNMITFDIELDYSCDNDFLDFNKYSVILNGEKMKLSEKHIFSEFVDYVGHNCGDKTFAVTSVKILSGGTPMETAQPSLFVKVKNKFEKNIFALLKVMKKV